MMHYVKLEYHELGLALSTLGTRDFKQLFQTVHRYCIASAYDPDAPIPTSDNEKINGFLFGICTRIQSTSVSHKLRSKVNRDNANKRWSKDGDHGGGGDDDHHRGDHRGGRGGGDHGGGDGGPEKSKAKAPITLQKFMGLAGDTADPERVKKLYHELDVADWIYCGYRLRDDNQCERCLGCYEDEHCRCGLAAIVYYNAITRNGKASEIFNALCDVGHELEWDFCDVTEMMQNVRMRDGRIVYRENGIETECETVEKFIDALRKLD